MKNRNKYLEKAFEFSDKKYKKKTIEQVEEEMFRLQEQRESKIKELNKIVYNGVRHK